MRLTIACVGRIKVGPERELQDRYIKRLSSGRGIGFGVPEIIELVEARSSSADERKADEAARLRTATTSAGHLIALDERGATLSSQAFAHELARLRDDASPGVAFVIGGPDGLDPAFAQSANKTLSLGAMTLPHGLARIVLIEQIYRAVTILSGHPYHRA